MAVGEYDKSQHLITGHTMRNKTDSKLDISDHNKFYNKNNTSHNDTGIARIKYLLYHPCIKAIKQGGKL